MGGSGSPPKNVSILVKKKKLFYLQCNVGIIILFSTTFFCLHDQ